MAENSEEKEEVGFGVIAIAGTVIVGLGYLIGSGAGVVVDELVIPPSNDDRPGQEVALQQYDAMFNRLAEQRTELDSRRAELSSVAGISNTPQLLAETVGLSAEEEEIYSTADRTRNELQQMEQSLSELSKRFAKSAIIDARLNEQNVRDLFNRFENEVGSFHATTGLRKPDFADLDLSRAAVAEENFSSEAEKALAIKKHSRQINGDAATSLGGKIGGGLAGGFFLLLLLMDYREERRKRKPKGLKH